jgi:hypothetical protein
MTTFARNTRVGWKSSEPPNRSRVCGEAEYRGGDVGRGEEADAGMAEMSEKFREGGAEIYITR